jgi:aromatic-L-amino-acid decarboxylase
MIDWLRQAMDLPAGFPASSRTAPRRPRSVGGPDHARARDGLPATARAFGKGACGSTARTRCIPRSTGPSGWPGSGRRTWSSCRPGPRHGMDVDALRAAIAADRTAGHVPAGIIADHRRHRRRRLGRSDRRVLGSRGTEDLYTPSRRGLGRCGDDLPGDSATIFWQGVEGCDSIVFNPHKWLGAQFDCSVQFLKDPRQQINTLKIEPEYLKTSGAEAVNYSEWTIPLGRRFRALKLWFLIRQLRPRRAAGADPQPRGLGRARSARRCRAMDRASRS